MDSVRRRRRAGGVGTMLPIGVLSIGVLSIFAIGVGSNVAGRDATSLSADGRPSAVARSDAASPRASALVSVIDRPGVAQEPADRGAAVQLEPAPVDPGCQPSAGVPISARQVVVIRSHGTFADVDLLERDDGGDWRCALRAVPARVGRNGTRPLGQRVSGDGTTPAGVFPLGTMSAPNGDTFQFFGNGADPGVKGGWHQVRPGDCWDATGGDATYNTLTNRAAANCTGDDEYLPNVPGAYSRAALIGANMGPDRSGDQPGEVPRAAAIFLHRFSYDAAGNSLPTSGCVSLAGPDLDVVLSALVPGEAWFAIT